MKNNQPYGYTGKPSPRRITIKNGKYFNPNKYGLGGLIGSGLGAIGGSFIGQPALGASIGGKAGALFDKEKSPEQPEEYTMDSGNLGTYKNGGYKGYAKGGYAKSMGKGSYKAVGRKHAQGGIVMSPDTEIEGGETIDADSQGSYIFSDRLKVPKSKETFAERHEKLMSMNADKTAVNDLAEMQERVSGRKKRNLGNSSSDWGKRGTVIAKGGYKSYALGGIDPPTGQIPRAPIRPTTVMPGGSNFNVNAQNHVGPNSKLYKPKSPSPSVKFKGASLRNTASNAGKLARFGRLAGPIATGATIGYTAASMAMGETPVNAWNRWGENADARDRATARRRQAERTAGREVSFWDENNPAGIYNLVKNNERPEQPSNEQASGSQQNSSNTYSPSPTGQSAGQRAREVYRKDRFDPSSMSNLANPGAYRGIFSNSIGAPRDIEGETFADTTNPNSTASRRNIGNTQANPEAEVVEEGLDDSGMTTMDYIGALAPTAINMAAGIFGKDKTKPATRVTRTKVGNQPINYNINPELRASAQGYRGILANPAASSQERLAALAAKGTNDSRAYAQKNNVEMQMREQRNARQAGLDANRNAQNASMSERYRQDKMAAEAQLGLTGNLSRQALSEAASTIMKLKAEGRMRDRDKQMEQFLRTYYGDDPAVMKFFGETE